MPTCLDSFSLVANRIRQAANLWVHAERSSTGFSQAELEEALSVSDQRKAANAAAADTTAGAGGDTAPAKKKKERKKREQKKEKR